jgi:hypothetical protein
MVEVYYKIDKNTKKRLYYKRYANGNIKQIDKATYDKTKIKTKKGGDGATLETLVISEGNNIKQPIEGELNTPLN